MITIDDQTARTALADLGGWQQLAALPAADLRAAVRTADPAAVALLTALHTLLTPPTPPHRIAHPTDLAGLLLVTMSHLEREELRVVLLTTKNTLIDIVTVYQGTVNSVTVRIAELFTEAVRQQATSLILVHNHPSGDESVSAEDKAITTLAIQAGRILEINTLDHLIIGHGTWSSLRQRCPDLWH